MYLRTVVSLDELPMVKGSIIFKYNTSFSSLNEDGENGKLRFYFKQKFCSRSYSIFKHNSSSSRRPLKALDELLFNAVSPQTVVPPSLDSEAVRKSNEVITMFAINSIITLSCGLLYRLYKITPLCFLFLPLWSFYRFSRWAFDSISFLGNTQYQTVTKVQLMSVTQKFIWDIPMWTEFFHMHYCSVFQVCFENRINGKIQTYSPSSNLDLINIQETFKILMFPMWHNWTALVFFILTAVLSIFICLFLNQQGMFPRPVVQHRWDLLD